MSVNSCWGSPNGVADDDDDDEEGGEDLDSMCSIVVHLPTHINKRFETLTSERSHALTQSNLIQ